MNSLLMLQDYKLVLEVDAQCFFSDF